jgi:hypothetical protein
MISFQAQAMRLYNSFRLSVGRLVGWSVSPHKKILAYVKIWLRPNRFVSGPSRLFWVTLVYLLFLLHHKPV